jgi:hypothetical protein
MFCAIGLIALVRIPSKILQPVVPLLTVVMTGFHPWRTWANECQENELMNAEAMVATASSQHRAAISLLGWTRA